MKGEKVGEALKDFGFLMIAVGLIVWPIGWLIYTLTRPRKLFIFRDRTAEKVEVHDVHEV